MGCKGCNILTNRPDNCRALILFMNKEQLTDDKVREIDKIAYQLTKIGDDKAIIKEPLKHDLYNGNTPMSQYNDIIQRNGLSDLYETFRLLLFAALCKQENELKDKLTYTINEKV